MASQALTDLPTELLDEIIPHVLPEGFESLALTCRTIYELCKPLIGRHNYLRSEFHRFWYMKGLGNPEVSTITGAVDLIRRVAFEPIVARYIRHADLTRDGIPHFAIEPLRQHLPDVHHGGPVVTLFAHSSHLRQAGLDWKEYYALIEEELEQDSGYSQHAAAFVLTLLPNVRTLTLPELWEPLDKTEKLLDVIVREAKRSNFPWNRRSLARVTEFELLPTWSIAPSFDLEKAFPFLALPHVRSFDSLNSVATGDAFLALASKNPYPHYGETLETVRFSCCCIDEVAIADFLKHTPRLRTLVYSHLTKRDGPWDWDICKFATAIEREAGAYLEALSISIDHCNRLPLPITPGKASMRGFQRLRKLEFPLEIAMCNITDAASTVSTPNEGLTDQELDTVEPFISDLVPASVSQLSLLSGGRDHHEEALKAMFFYFAAKKDFYLPTLKEIYLSCPRVPPRRADYAYKEECEKLVAETAEAGVVLYLTAAGQSTMARKWCGP